MKVNNQIKRKRGGISNDKSKRTLSVPNQVPETFFLVNADDVVEVREYCTVHGLWKS